jgi:hypothetical protein
MTSQSYQVPPPRHWVEMQVEVPPAYVANSGMNPVCVADTRAIPALLPLALETLARQRTAELLERARGPLSV